MSRDAAIPNLKPLKNHLDADFAENAEKTLKLFEKLLTYSQAANDVKFFAQKFKKASGDKSPAHHMKARVGRSVGSRFVRPVWNSPP